MNNRTSKQYKLEGYAHLAKTKMKW